MISHWLAAARLRTLPLALSSTIFASTIAYALGSFDLKIFLLGLLTTLLLQIFSNFANDLGDYENGADNETRVGPLRMVQQGAITAHSMKKALIITGSLAFASGITLLLFAGLTLFHFIVMLSLGCIAIAAALFYTYGKFPYGYAGLGDLSVLLFFGIVGVGGMLFLYAKVWHNYFTFPALAIGAWAVAVLNLNNLRDCATDSKAHKRTIPVRFGLKNAQQYHLALMLLPIGAWVAFVKHLPTAAWAKWGFLAWIALGTLYLIVQFQKASTSSAFDSLLKPTALFSFLSALLSCLFLIR